MFIAYRHNDEALLVYQGIKVAFINGLPLHGSR